MQNPRARVIAAIAALIAAISLTIVITDDTGPGGHHRTVTIRVGTDSNRADGADATITVPAAAVAQADASELGHHDDLKSETGDLNQTERDASQEAQDQAARSDQLPAVTPDAAPQQAGCASRFVASYSSRRGVAPRWFVLHYTVSPNRPGWSDVDSVVALFSRLSFQASSNYVLDREAHCAYIVRESDKAWTQAAANPWAISVEIINSGSEHNLIDGAGYRQLVRIVGAAARRWHIPLQTGSATSACTPARAGIVTHHLLGPCAGGHVDISIPPRSTPNPTSDERAFLTRLISDVRAAHRPLGTRLQVRCRRIAWYRHAGRPTGTPTRRYRLRLAYVHKHGARCTLAGKAIRA